MSADMTGRVPASPPDVRQGSALPATFFFNAGFALGSGLAPKISGQRPHRGHSPHF